MLEKITFFNERFNSDELKCNVTMVNQDVLTLPEQIRHLPVLVGGVCVAES